VVGQAQGLGLAFKGADGKAYTFRSLHKHPERMLPEEWRDRFPAKIAQDQSRTPPRRRPDLRALARAAGVTFTNPRLVSCPTTRPRGIPQDLRGRVRERSTKYPLPATEGRPGFMGATEIISTTDLWERWLAGPENRIDSRAFLKARALDLWLDNYDDHRGQCAWMRIPGQDLYQPLAETGHGPRPPRRDAEPGPARRIPKLLKFTPEYPGKLEGPLQNSFEVDRWLLSDLDAAAWQEVAKDLQGRLTDDVIEKRAAADAAPVVRDRRGGQAGRAQTRRAGFVDYILRVYRYYAKKWMSTRQTSRRS